MLLVEEAGGRVTNWAEEPYHPGDHELVATNGHIHREFCRIGRRISRATTIP